MKRVYIAAKIVPGNNVVRTLLTWLETRGYVRAHDWTQGVIRRPFTDNQDAQEAARQMVEAVMNCDVFVLIATSDIVGALGELVAALGATSIRNDGTPTVYVVGEAEERETSIFYHHPAVNWFNTIDDLMAAIGQD